MNLETENFLVVGTDTGVGKTVFAGLFGMFLRQQGVGVSVLKPFCSGGKADIEFLQAAQSGLSQKALNFWYSDEPISPAAWELRHGQAVDFDGCIARTQQKGAETGVLLIEGVGGLLAPLTKGKTVASLGQALGAQLIVVAPNRVGVINQVLLTIEAAAKRDLEVVLVVLMGEKETDDSVPENTDLIRQNLPEMTDFKGVIEFPYLGS
ncbi:MAG TPA: dethiobiotin synthase, partial [Verrucomicrobia bacterium]|nr:dethiobiotin synthase [Verrucomicrobiota bacterium]